MFGYVIPVQGELRMRELNQFKGAYCGLCHRLKQRYGFAARFVLNYDFTFLAMLLSCDEAAFPHHQKRCAASPFRKKCCISGGEAFSKAAGYSLILSWWKLQDGITDSGPLGGLPYRGASLFLWRAYRRAVRDFPAFDAHCRRQLETLGALEQAGSGELDRVADAFAAILSFAAREEEDGGRRRILEQLLYQTGRWITLIDAYDDLEQDRRRGVYNPLLARFQPEGGKLGEGDRAWIKTTLTHSENLIAAAYHLLPAGQWKGILENIIYLGFPAVREGVLEGRFRRGRRALKTIEEPDAPKQRKDERAI